MTEHFVVFSTVVAFFVCAAMGRGGLAQCFSETTVETESDGLDAQDSDRQCLEQLRDKDPHVRNAALDDLKKMKSLPDRFVDAVGNILLSDPETEVRISACRLLEKEQSPKALDYWKRALKADCLMVRANAARDIGIYGKNGASAVPDMLVSLDDERNMQMSGLDSITTAHDILRPIRYYVVESLGQIGPSARVALPKLISIMRHDDDLQMRISAAAAVIKIGGSDREALNVLLDALSYLGRKDADICERNLDKSLVRFEAVTDIAEAGPLAKSALPELLKRYDGEKDAFVRSGYITAFGSLGVADKRIVELLKTALREKKEYDVVYAAVRASRSQGPLAISALPELTDILNNYWKECPDLNVAGIEQEAVNSIAAIADQAFTIDVLCQRLLAETNKELLACIVEQLGSYGPEAWKAIPTLKMLLQEHRDAEKLIDEALDKILGVQKKTERNGE